MNKICFSSEKRRYSTEKEAQTVILLVGVKYESGKTVILKTYLCEDCNGWHLTKTNR